jgi:GPH family glycoside/pentoside/hexuronide:cation symporter
MLFMTYFYTDVFGLPTAAIATLFLVTRIWDAVNDPIMGTIADHTKTRWGKFRPYILFMSLPFCVMGVLAFTTPDFTVTGKLIYAYITYNLMMMTYTAVNVPYSALMGVITPNSMERTELSTYRFVAAFIGGLIVQGSMMFLVKYFGQGNEATGWQWAMACLSGLALLLFIVTFATTKERVQPPKEQKNNLKVDLKDLFSSKPWLLIAGATIFQLLFIVIRSSMIMYYFKYYVGDQSVPLLGNIMNLGFGTLAATFMISGSVVTILGSIFTKWLSKKFDKRNTYMGALFISALCTGLFYFLQPQDVVLMFTLNIIVSFAFGPVSVLQWAMYTDTADFSEWKNKRRATGLIMAASLFALKMGLTLGGAVVAWMLGYYGFVANEAQSVVSAHGIVLLMSIYPAIFGIIGSLLVIFYPLTNEIMIKIEEDLTARHQAE